MESMLSGGDEQSEEERLEIARRYRRRRGDELLALAGSALDTKPVAAAQFSTVPIESLAAIPVVGAFFAFATRVRHSKKSLTQNVMLALDRDDLHLLAVDTDIEGPKARLVSTWPRSSAHVGSVTPKFMRAEVIVEFGAEVGAEPLKLYATSLKTDPWASEVIRLLGGEAPEPLDIGSD